MLFEFYPWKMDIDVEKTKRLYAVNDWSLEKEDNQRFVGLLDEKQTSFFSTIGADPMKIKVEAKRYDLSELDAGEKEINMLSVAFLACGRFAAMPADQIELYQDEEVYGIEIPADSLESIHGDDENMLLSYDDLGLGIGLRFKHPISQFQGAQYEKWDCGYICGMTLIYY